MIVCQCNVLTKQDIESAVSGLLSRDPSLQVTPGRVIRALKARRQCSGCLPALTDMIDGCQRRCGTPDCPKRAQIEKAIQPTNNNQLEGEYA